MENINIQLAGIPVAIHLRYPDSLLQLEPYRTDTPPIAQAQVPEEHMAMVRHLYTPEVSEAYIEATEIATFACRALLPFHRAIFHSVAFTWQDRGYLLTAPSGTGKTTQYALWKTLYGSEVQMINGDKPALSFEGERITIHPTPWAGKENMSQMRTAPLAGIVLLEQAQTDEIRLLQPTEAIARIFCQFMIPAEQTEEAVAVAAMTDRLLHETPVWLFRNRGLRDGTKICRDALLQYEKERNK